MIPTYTQLIDRAMTELRAQKHNGIGSLGLCFAINRAEGSFPRCHPDHGTFEDGYRTAMRHLLLGSVWIWGKRSRTDPKYLHPAPGQRGWKAERMRILRAMKRHFKGM